MNRTRVLTLVVGLHVVLSGSHGLVHAVVPVVLPAELLVSAGALLFLLPLAGLAILSRGRVRAGTALVLVGLLAGALFETIAHFVVPNPDHVSQTGHIAFAPTAVGSTAATTVATVVAAWCLASKLFPAVASQV